MESKKVDLDTLVKVRNFKEEDRSFILSTWLRGYYYGNPATNEIPKSAFMLNYNKILNNLINSGKVSIKIACLIEDENAILSYIVTGYQDRVIHWIFSKAAWRKIGLAKLLWPKSAVAVSHLTTLGRTLVKKAPGVKYNPFTII